MTIFRFQENEEEIPTTKDKKTSLTTPKETIIMSNKKPNISLPKNNWEMAMKELLPSKHSSIPRKNVISSKPTTQLSPPFSHQIPMPILPEQENIIKQKYMDRNEIIGANTERKFIEIDGRVTDINKMAPKLLNESQKTTNDLDDITNRINDMKLEIKRLTELKEMEEKSRKDEADKEAAVSIKLESDLRESLLKKKAGAEAEAEAAAAASFVATSTVSSSVIAKPSTECIVKPSTECIAKPSNTHPETKQKISLSIARFLEIESIAKPFLESANRIDSNPKHSANKLKIRMSITRRVGQIANSKRQVHAVIRDLLLLFSDANTKFGDDMANYCVVKCCEKIIDQAETQVCLHSPSAFPLAQMVIDLSVQQKNLIPILTHLVHKRCPYSVPRYIPRENGQSHDEHLRAMGYLILEDEDNPKNPASIEGEQNYIERMTGILTLYGAIIVAKPTIGVPSLFGVENAWLWTASVLNIHPEPITPYMVCSFLESSGYSLWLSYGETFIKLLIFIKEKYLAMIPDGSVGAKTRLDIYCHYILEKKMVSKPEGFDILP